MSHMRWMMIGAVVALLTGCIEETPYEEPAESCPQGEVIEFEGDMFCILIEEGFLVDDCPEDFPEGEEVEDVVVCAEEGEDIPEEIEDELRERGLIEEEPDLCQEVEDAYEELIEGARDCGVDSDCQVLNGACGLGIGGCYEIVNTNISQEDLTEIVRGDDPGLCMRPVCDCPEPPAGAVCNSDGICEAAEVEPPSTCPEEVPIRGTCSDADQGLRCEYGQECCCGECFASTVCTCENGEYVCFATDACFNPDCGGECDGMSPVCGANGVTYRDSCEADEANVGVLYEGECRACDADALCGDDEYCKSQDGVCGESFERGFCVPRPDICTDDAPGACGCDGGFYTNACNAATQGVDVVQFGGCGDGDTFACGRETRCQKGTEGCSIAFNDVFGPDEPEFFENCFPLPDACDAENPSCDCIEGDGFNTCVDRTGQIIVLNPGG